MVDYYAELNIDRSLSVDEIIKELSKLESTWKRRELNSPEKATKILALIIDAREVFKNTATKNKYDHELAESKQPSKPVDPDQQRKDDIQRWKTDADAYYDRGEYDLAKIAVDRALALVTDSSDDELYFLAASVYMEIEEYNTALSFINNAIVLNPQNGLHYLVKAGIYGRSASALKFNDRYKSSQYYEEGRKALQIGLDVASSTDDTYAKGRLMGALAFSLYFQPNPDRVKAEELAREALTLGENLGNAQRVIDAVNEQRRAEERALREQWQREEELARQAKQKAEQDEAERQAAEEYAKRVSSTAKRLRVLILIAGAVLILFEIVSLTHFGRESLKMRLAFLPMGAYCCCGLLLSELNPDNPHWDKKAIRAQTEEEKKVVKIFDRFVSVGLLNFTVYPIAYAVRWSAYGALLRIPLIEVGSFFLGAIISAVICGILPSIVIKRQVSA